MIVIGPLLTTASYYCHKTLLERSPISPGACLGHSALAGEAVPKTTEGAATAATGEIRRVDGESAGLAPGAGRLAASAASIVSTTPPLVDLADLGRVDEAVAAGAGVVSKTMPSNMSASGAAST